MLRQILSKSICILALRQRNVATHPMQLFLSWFVHFLELTSLVCGSLREQLNGHLFIFVLDLSFLADVLQQHRLGYIVNEFSAWVSRKFWSCSARRHSCIDDPEENFLVLLFDLSWSLYKIHTHKTSQLSLMTVSNHLRYLWKLEESVRIYFVVVFM